MIFSLLVSLPFFGCGHDTPPDGGTDGGWDGGAILEIVHIDVGEGDATLIVGPDGTTILVDSGPEAAAAEVRSALARRGVGRLSYLVATHPDADHIGAFDALLLSGLEVEAAWGNGVVSDTKAYRDLVRALEGTEAGGLQRLAVGQVLELGAQARARCTICDGELPDGTQLAVSDDNDRGLALHLEFGGFDYHVGGDLGGGGLGSADVETPLGEVVGDVDVLHLHHHGSATSTNARWLTATRPEVAVLSVGPNSYGHPHLEVIERLAGHDPAVGAPAPWLVQTGAEGGAGEVLGTFSLETDGRTYRLAGREWEVDEP